MLSNLQHSTHQGSPTPDASHQGSPTPDASCEAKADQSPGRQLSQCLSGVMAVHWS